MHILIVHNFYRERGGEDTVVDQDVATLRQRGETVSTYYAHNNEIITRGDRFKTGLGVIYNWQARRAFSSYLRSNRPDVVHVHNFFPQLSPSILDACKSAGVPCAMTLHNYRILCPTALLYHDERIRERSLSHSSFWTIPRAVYRGSLIGTLLLSTMVEFHKWRGTWRIWVDRFIAVTDFAKAKFAQGGVPEERIVVASHSADDMGALAPAADVRTGALFVGRLSPEKGLEQLLNAWRTIDYPLTIAGDGPLMDALKAEAPPNVKFSGRLERGEIAALMARSAFLIVPSLCYEMFGLVVIEAFSASLPVLTSNTAGLTEMISHDDKGLTFDPRDIESIWLTVEQALAYPDKLAAMGKRGRLAYERHYTADAHYHRLIAIYREIMAAA